MNAPINKPEENALVAAAPRQQFDLSPQNFEQALVFSDYLAASEMVPKNFRNKPGDCLVAMQWGCEVGLKALQALQSIAVINGKPGLFGDAGKAILLAAGCIIEEDDTAVVKANGRGRCKITRPGRPPVERTFSMEDAKTANLWGKEGPWKTYPYRQMAWRAFWFAARDAASDLLRGMAGAEELVDTPTERYMGPADVVQPAAPTPPASYTDDQFKANLVKWREVISSKRKTADELIAWVEAKGAPFTDAQKAELRAEPAAPVFTYAQVAEKITGAKNLDALVQAADLITAVADAGQQEELKALYVTRSNELSQ